MVGVIFTVADVATAAQKSYDKRSYKPIAAETVRQVGGWAGAVGGAKIGFLVGAALGVETGPGVFVTGAIGSIIFGAAGYFGANWVAGWIDEDSVSVTALRAAQSMIPDRINLFGDKTYLDRCLKECLEARHIQLLIPKKKPKGGELSKSEKHYNKLVSKIRQPIESFFKWLIDKTDIQRANQVRSTDGLLLHCLGKLSFALLLLTFYY